MGIPYRVLDYIDLAQSMHFFGMVQKGKCDLAREEVRQLNPIIHFYGVNLRII